MSTPTQLDRIEAKLDQLLAERAHAKSAPDKPEQPLTISEFADRVGFGRKTITRHVKEGTIKSLCGRIPASELRRFGL